MSEPRVGPWREPDGPPDPACDLGCPGCNPWPVYLAWQGRGRDRDGRLPYRQKLWGRPQFPSERVVQLCVRLPGQAGHADVMCSGDAVWVYLARTEEDAHGEDHDRMAQLEWLNTSYGKPPPPAYVFRLPDGAANLVVNYTAQSRRMAS